MRKLKNEIKIDRANCAAEYASKEEATMRNSSKKTPWHLRFAPGAILRKKAIIAILALATVLSPISAIAVHPVVAFLYGWAAGETLGEAKQALMDHYLSAKNGDRIRQWRILGVQLLQRHFH